MNLEKLTAGLLAFALVVAACGDSDDEAVTTTAGTDTSTTTESVTSTTENVTSTSEDVSSTIEPFDGSEAAVHECIVSSDLLWSPSEAQAIAVIDQLLPGGEILTSFDGRPGLVGLVPPNPEAVLGSDFGRYISLSGTTLTPPQVLGFVSHANQQLGADTVFPVYAAAFGVHWGLEPGGDDYQSTTEAPTFGDSDAGNGEFIGIVDSGFPDLQGWPDLADIALEAADKTDTSPSHGTFVTSIIKQLAPRAMIVGTKAGRSSEQYVQDGEPMAPEDLTDELAVVSALQRIREELTAQDNSTLPIINLSLGTYACPSPTGPDIPPPGAIGAFLQDWSGKGATIFAAAGNEYLADDAGNEIATAFYPAAYSYVTGVAAINREGEAVVWDEGVVTKDDGQGWEPSSRTWAEDSRLGVGILGVAQATAGTWSGSSFATAVASGLAAAGTAEDTDPACPTGLRFLDGNGDLQVCP